MNSLIHKTIKQSPLFEGLTDEEFTLALEFFKARELEFKKGEYLNTIGNILDFFGLVLKGSVQVYTVDIDGMEMIMANVQTGDTFGDSLNYLENETEIYITATTDTTVLMMSTDRIKSVKTPSAFELVLIRRFISQLAKRTLSMNNRIQIMSKLTIRNRLTAFFTECIRKYNSNEFDIPFDREDMALYLGCDRCALSRELSKMKREGFVDFKKKHFMVTYHSKK